MTEVNFKPLFDYMDEKFGEQNKRFDNIEESLNVLQTSVDGLAKQVKDFRDEHIVLYRRLEVLEEWAKQASKKLGISLPQ